MASRSDQPPQSAANSPLVSILIPTFNENPDTIALSFQSIRNQTWQDFECLVIDESTDGDKAEAIRRECELDDRFTYIHPESRLGLAGSLNLGLAQARGNLIARCDSDDICLPDRMDAQVSFLENHPEVGIVGGSVEIVDDAGASAGFRHYPCSHKAIYSSMMLTNAMAHPTVMFRKSIADSFGTYDPKFRYAEDLELWLRWLNAGVQFRNLQQVLLKYRQQTTTREIENWRYNLRARVRHYSYTHLLARTLGIVGIAIWSRIPPPLQERLFRVLLFRRQKPPKALA